MLWREVKEEVRHVVEGSEGRSETCYGGRRRRKRDMLWREVKEEARHVVEGSEGRSETCYGGK